jgi:hypothetical protein
MVQSVSNQLRIDVRSNSSDFGPGILLIGAGLNVRTLMIQVPMQVAREVSLDCFCQNQRVSSACSRGAQCA